MGKVGLRKRGLMDTFLKSLQGGDSGLIYFTTSDGHRLTSNENRLPLFCAQVLESELGWTPSSAT